MFFTKDSDKLAVNNGRRLQGHVGFILFFLFMLNTSLVFATPSRTTYQARIVKPDGYPLESANVNFRFSILDSPGSCVLYVENYTGVNMASTGGLIAFSLGSGVKTYPVSSTTFAQVFSNITPNIACDANGVPSVYTPTANDGRKIVMQFNDGSGWQTLPAMTINAVPYAMYADNATKFNGMAPSEFVQVSTIPTCAASSALRYTGASFVCEAVVAGGSVTSASVITALGYTPADGASVTTVSANLNSVSSSVFSVSSTVSSLSSSVSSLQSSVAASFAAITSSQWFTSGTTISYSSGNVGININNPVAKLHVSDNVATTILVDGHFSGTAAPGYVLRKSRGTAASPTAVLADDYLGTIGARGYGTTGFSTATKAMIGFKAAENWTDADQGTTIVFETTAVSTTTRTEKMRITENGFVGIGTAAPVTTLDVSGAIRIAYQATCSASYAGTIRYNAGAVEYCNGTTWAAFGVSGSGLTLLNGSASNTQTFQFGSAGTAPAINTAAGVHTFNIPLASAGSVTAGLLSNTDYVSFQNKASAASVTNLITDLSTVSATLSSVSSNLNSVSSSLNTAAANISAVSSSLSSLSASVATSLTNLTSTVSAITSSQWTSVASGIHYSSGFAAIGASATGYNFFVRNNSNTNNPVGIQNNSASGYAGIDLLNTSGTNVAGFAYSNPGTAYLPGSMWIGPRTTSESLHFVAGNAVPTARMTLTASGYFGIGTSAPTTRLHLVGNSGGNLARIEEQINGASGAYLQLAHSRAGNSLVNNDFTGGIYFQGMNSGNINVVDVANIFSQMTNVASGSESGNLSIYTRHNGIRTEKLRIDSNGNIGVGTNAPTALLHLQAGTSSSAALKLTSGTLLTSPTSGSIEYDGSYYYITDGNNTRRAIATVAAPGTFDNASVISNSGNITLVPTGSVIVSATTASTNSQTGALVVNGGLGVAGNIYASGTIVTSGNIQGASITATNGVSTTVVQGVPYLLLNPAGGNVGIGNSNPQTTLEIGTNTVSSSSFRFNSNTTYQSSMRFVADSTANWIQSGLDYSNDSKKDLKFSSINGVTTWMTLQASTGNLGIGTAAPAAKLAIHQDGGAIRLQAVTENIDNSSRIVFAENSSTEHFVLRYDASNAQQGSGALTFNGSGFGDIMSVTRAGRVGIGTVAPQVQLTVDSTNGTVSAPYATGTDKLAVMSTGNAVIQVTTPNTQSGAIYFSDPESRDPGGVAYSHVSDSMIFRANGATRMTLTASGNLGIGTGSPQARLGIAGSSIASASPQTNVSDFANNGIQIAGSISNVSQDGIFYQSGGSGGGTGIAFRRGSIYDTYMDFYTNNIASAGAITHAMTINNLGNLGIGTQNPQSKLHVNIPDNTSIYFGPNDGVNSNFRFLNKYTDGFNFIQVGVSSTDTSAKLKFSRNGSSFNMADFRVLSDVSSFNGNVGIGTTTPDRNLTIAEGTGGAYRGLAVRTFNANSGGVIEVGGALGSVASPTALTINKALGYYSFAGYDGVSFTMQSKPTSMYSFSTENWSTVSRGAYIRFATTPNGTANGVDRMIIDQDGDVGIGTMNPAGSLHIVSTVSQSNAPGQGIFLGRSLGEDHQIQITEVNGTPHIDLSRGASTDYDGRISVTQNNSMSLGTASSTQLVHLVNSSVGIGTTTPSAKLHVFGGQMNVESNNTNGILGAISISGRNSSAALPQYSQWTLYNMNEYGTSKGLTFFEYYDADNNGTLCGGGDTCASRVTFAQGGNVGIGVGDPTTKLQVAGQITPASDNAHTLGTGALRFSAVYAVNGAIQTSDARQKKNITESDLGLDFINKLRPVSYNWKFGDDQSVHYGLIAQETEKIVNESRTVKDGTPTPIVDYDKESGRYGLRYTELISPIIKAVQELYSKIMGHNERLELQERKIASVEAENAKLKQENEEIKARLERLEKALEKK